MASLLSYALTTLADVKESMGVASSDQTWDNLIIRKINQATRQIEAYCGRRFALTTYTDEIYDSTGTNQLLLRNRPIVGSVTLSSRDTSLNEADFDDIDSELYFLNESSGVLNLDFTTTGNWGQYKVTYQAGYSTIPEDLAEACATLAAYYVLNASPETNVVEKQEGSRRIRYGQGAKSFDNVLELLGIDGIINSYANYPVSAI